jgi:hypothetical protein
MQHGNINQIFATTYSTTQYLHKHSKQNYPLTDIQHMNDSDTFCSSKEEKNIQLSYKPHHVRQNIFETY